MSGSEAQTRAMKKYIEKNKEALAAYRKGYYAANKARLLERQREYNKKNAAKVKAKTKEYGLANRERIMAGRATAYHCDTCDRDMQLGSRYLHIRSKMHTKKLGIENDLNAA